MRASKNDSAAHYTWRCHRYRSICVSRIRKRIELAVRFDFALHCRLHATLPRHPRARRAAIGRALQVMGKPLPQAARISHELNRRHISSCAVTVSATYAHIAASSQRCIESCGVTVTVTYASQARIESSGVCNVWFDRHRNMRAPGAHRNSAAL